MEIELKLLVDQQSSAALQSYPALAAGRSSGPQTLTATYFDTPDFGLWRHGASLRVRRSPKGLVQTVKIDPGGLGVGERGEWEWAVDTEEPDLGRLESLPERHRALRDIAGEARAVFTTQVERRTWICELAGGTVVEAALDSGSVIAGSARSEIAELELELKSGPKAPLFGLAIALADRFALRYGSLSKADRGYGLLTDALPPRHSAAEVRLDDDMPVVDAFPVLLGGILTSLAAEIPLATRGDVEGVHRLRAAIRKARSLFVLFGPNLEPQAAHRFNAGLWELGRRLGEARDWDVFMTETLPAAREHAEAGLLEPIGSEAEAARTRAQAAVAEVMTGMGPTRLLLGLAAWVADPGWFVGSHRHRPLRAGLDDMLSRLERKVRRRAKRIDHDEPEALHDLRKSMKKLRYAVEFVGSLYREKDVARYLDALKDVLSVLGRINDAAVARSRIEDLAPNSRPELAPAAAALLSWSEQRTAKTLRKLDGKLKDFRAAEPFWA